MVQALDHVLTACAWTTVLRALAALGKHAPMASAGMQRSYGLCRRCRRQRQAIYRTGGEEWDERDPLRP